MAKLLDISQRGAPVGLGLACPEQIEIGAVEDVNGFCHRRSAAGTNGGRPFIRTSGGKGNPMREPPLWFGLGINLAAVRALASTRGWLIGGFEFAGWQVVGRRS